MSRIGKSPIVVPAAVKVNVSGKKVSVQGPKGKLDMELPRRTSLKVEGDKISFNEPLTIDGNEIIIIYSGTLSGDELKLTRVVGEFGTEQLTAKRASTPPSS